MTLKGKIFAYLFFFMMGTAVGGFIGFKSAPIRQLIETNIGKVKQKNSSGNLENTTDIDIDQKNVDDKSKRKRRIRNKKNKGAE